MKISPDRLIYNVKNVCMSIHKEFGPGLLENAYQQILKIKLLEKGYDVKTEVPCDIQVDGMTIKSAYRIDMIVNDCLIVELKTVNKILPVHHRQLATYMTLAKKEVGLLVNFYCNDLFEEGLRSWNNSQLTHLP